MLAKHGTYALILVSSSDRLIQIGKLGQLLLQPGYYVYAGSAFGPLCLCGQRLRARGHKGSHCASCANFTTAALAHRLFTLDLASG
jgi:hypothetical protein